MAAFVEKCMDFLTTCPNLSVFEREQFDLLILEADNEDKKMAQIFDMKEMYFVQELEESKRLENLVNRLQNRIRCQHTEVCELTSINRTLELEISKFEDTGEIEKLRKFNLELIRKNSELTTENEDFITKRERAEQHFESLKADKKKQKCEMKALKKTEDAKTVKLVELADQINRLEAESVELKQTRQELKTHQNLLTEKTKKLTKTEAELSEFKDQLSKSRMNNISRVEFEKIHRQEKQSKAKITLMSEKVLKLEKENFELKQQKSIMLADSNKRTDELDNLRSANKNLEKLIDDLLKPRIEALGKTKTELVTVDNNNNDVNSSKLVELEKIFVDMQSKFASFGTAFTSMKKQSVVEKCDLCDKQISSSGKHKSCSHEFCEGCFSKSQCNICYKTVHVKVNSFQNVRARKFKKK
jgi:myosin heavy subunit